MATKKKGRRSSSDKLDEDFVKRAARLLHGETLDEEHLQRYRLHARVLRKYPRRRFNVAGVDDQWAMDLLDMHTLANYNDQMRYVLVCVDVYSRFAFARLSKSKRARNVADKFETILNANGGRIPKKIQCDEGTEFQEIRTRLSREYGFVVFHTYNREIKAAHAERFIETLREMIERMLDVIRRGFNYKRFLQLIVDKYNDSPHKGLHGLTPRQVYMGDKKINKAKRLKNILNTNLKKPVKKIFREGTRVRVARARNTPFEKASLQRWKDEVFIIDKVFLEDPVYYTLRDLKGEEITGTFYTQELQKV